MKIEKINIDSISDDKRFLDVALLVDQPFFLGLVTRAREVLIRELDIRIPMSYGEYLEFIKKLYEKPEQYEKVESLIEKSLRWLHISIAHANIIRAAIFTGEVRSADFRPVLLSSEISVNPDKLNLRYTHFIILTPNATKSDVDSAFLRYKAGFKKVLSKRDLLHYKEFDDQYLELTSEELEEQRNQLAEYAYLSAPGISSREKGQLRKYRKWHWLDLEVRIKYDLYKNGVFNKTKKLPHLVYREEVLNKIANDANPYFKVIGTVEAQANEIKKGVTFYRRLLGKSKTR